VVDGAARSARIPAGIRRFAVRERPYVIACAVLTLLLVGVMRPMPWGDDLTLHLAVLRRLLENPVHPGNPVLDVGGGSAYYSPYTVGLALLGKPLGLSALTLYRFVMPVNGLLLMSGLYRFIRTLSQAEWAPPLALVGLLLWWGTDAITFSGYLSLDSLCVCAAYPSTVGTALALHLWASLNGSALRPQLMAGLGVLLGVLLLVHQFTGLSATVGCAAILVSRHRDTRSAEFVRALLLGFAACAAVVLVWPYYHLWDVGEGQLLLLDPVHHSLYEHIDTWYPLALPGVFALVLFWRRVKTDVLVLMFLGMGAVVVFGWLSGHWSFGRSWPMLMFTLQAALAVQVAETPPGRMRVAWGVPVAAVTAMGLWAQAGALMLTLPAGLNADVARLIGRHEGLEEQPHADWLQTFVKPTDVVLADVPLAQFEVAAHGAYNVASPWPLPEITEAEDQTRAVDVATILNPCASPVERETLLARYHVVWVLLTTGEQLPAYFPAVRMAADPTMELYRIY
jgi:alpha-1,6-mannosyltransferase